MGRSRQSLTLPNAADRRRVGMMTTGAAMKNIVDALGIPENGTALIFAGPSGSGKTEITVNVALSLVRSTPSQVMLCDLDVVKAYFRLRDILRLLTEEQAARFRIVEPLHQFLHADMPIFPSNLLALLSDSEAAKIIDVGGDAIGIGAIAQFRETIIDCGYRLYLVINTLRPGMNTLPGLCHMFDGIRAGARLEIAGLIANTNLQNETTPEEVQRGYDLVKALGDRKGVPVVALVASSEYAKSLENHLSPDAAKLLSVIQVFNRILDSVDSQTEF